LNKKAIPSPNLDLFFRRQAKKDKKDELGSTINNIIFENMREISAKTMGKLSAFYQWWTHFIYR